MIQDCINAKNFKEFTLEFKSQDLRQMKSKKTDSEFVRFRPTSSPEIRTSSCSVTSPMAEAFIGAGDRVQMLVLKLFQPFLTNQISICFGSKPQKAKICQKIYVKTF